MKRVASLILPMLLICILSYSAKAQLWLAFRVSIETPPPPIPAYEQPPCPVDGYLWIPGYWAYEDDDYYWVPGAWVRPARAGWFWTPGYWSDNDGIYVWTDGYWGPTVGYYGGVCYGYGYFGSGFSGGYWKGKHFRYNTAVWYARPNVVSYTYVDRRPASRGSMPRGPSYYGPRGGTNLRPTETEQAALRQEHMRPTAEQYDHRNTAREDRKQFMSVNKGRPERTVIDNGAGKERVMTRSATPERRTIGKQTAPTRVDKESMRRNEAASNKSNSPSYRKSSDTKAPAYRPSQPQRMERTQPSMRQSPAQGPARPHSGKGKKGG